MDRDSELTTGLQSRFSVLQDMLEDVDPSEGPAFVPPPSVLFAPITQVTATAKHLVAFLLREFGVYASLHVAEPSPSDPHATVVMRSYSVWDQVPLAQNGSLLYNDTPVRFTGLGGTQVPRWVALSADPYATRLLFYGELPWSPVTFSDEKRSLTLPTASIQIAVA